MLPEPRIMKMIWYDRKLEMMDGHNVDDFKEKHIRDSSDEGYCREYEFESKEQMIKKE
jgi:hypothetical protein